MENKKGWGHPALSRKWHYFPEDDMRSLCMRWMFTGYLEEDVNLDEHKDNCAECKRKLKALRKQS